MLSSKKENELKTPSEELDDLISLPFRIKKTCTSQDPLYPISNLSENNNSNNGWISEKFCDYPQKIIVQFNDYVDINQINIIINEAKIPSIIQFINCIKIF